MINPSCTSIPCEPVTPEPLPGAQLPCGAFANCDGGDGPTPPGGLTSVAANDSTTVDFSGNGTVGNPLTAGVKVSPDEGNLLLATPNGLFIELPTFTSWIDLAMSASSGWQEDEYLFAHQFSDAATIPLDFERSIGVALNHTGGSPVSVLVNDAQVATITLQDGVFVFTAIAGDLVFARGDVLALQALSVATFDYAALTLAATRTVRYA